MERTGPAERGSITAIYTILVDGEDMDEPIADISRATLDGHIVLRRTFANAGHYPPIDVLGSISRLMERVATPEHRESARQIRSLLAAHADARDLISIGAYVRGSDPLVDRAVDLMPQINGFLRQAPLDVTGYNAAVEALVRINGGASEGDAHDPYAPTLETAGEAT